jgi:hypothetical protein
MVCDLSLLACHCLQEIHIRDAIRASLANPGEAISVTVPIPENKIVDTSQVRDAIRFLPLFSNFLLRNPTSRISFFYFIEIDDGYSTCG